MLPKTKIRLRICRTMVESVGSCVWTINADLRTRLNAVELDYLLQMRPYYETMRRFKGK